MNLKKLLFILLIFNLFVLSNTAYATDFYWIGNSGNWNDAAHWSATSDGNGGFGVPSINDDVFIDKKSLKKNGVITILNNAVCNSFNWNSNKSASLKAAKNAQLKINGSFFVNGNFENNFLGRLIFTSKEQNNTISAVRKDFAGDIEFNGSGSWNVISNIITPNKNTIYLIQGEVKVTNKTISTGGLDASGSLNKKLTLTDAIFYVHQKIVLNNAPNFILTKNNTNIIINNKAKENNLRLGNYNPSSFSFTNNFRLLNTCGAVPLTVTLTVLSDYNGFGESCVGSCDGIVYVTYTGGVGPFVTSWPSQPTVTGDTIYNVCGADNPIRVIIEDLGQPTPPFGNLTCEETINVNPPPLMVVSLLGTIEPSCHGDCNGVIGTNILFGVSPYNITWTNTTQTTPIINNLCAGSYTISIVDQNFCTLDSTFVLTEPPLITFDLDSTNINCFGTCNGEAWISNVTGGNGTPYTFSWTNPVSNNDSITGLCAGNYVITVSDDSLCFTKDSVNIIEPPQMVINTSDVMVSCGGLCDGSATVTVNSGGVPPYTHTWSTGQVFVGLNSSINGLCFGTYTDSIVDAVGCDTVITFIITEPNILTTTTTPTNITCNGLCDGTATTIPAGGTAPYNSIVYDMIPTQAPFPFNGDPVNNLCAGNYFVTITDNKNCTVQDTFTIIEPPLLLANVTFTNVTCVGFCDGTATATPTGGTTPYSYSWIGPGGPYNTQTINSLCPGQYIVTVSDFNNNCTALDTVNITEPLPLNLAMSSTDETCGGVCDGTAVVNVSGGTIPYTFVWVPDPGVLNGQGTDSIFNLCPGNYTVNINDLAGCTANNNVTINPQIPIVINLTTSDLSCNGICNGTATVAPSGGVAPYDVSWNGGPFVTGDVSITSLCAGNYTVDVRDFNGCTFSLSFTITEPLLLTTNTSSTNLTCFNVCDGSATTIPAGGTAPYVVSWSGPGGPYTGTVLNNLCAGTYIVTITDDSLCIVQDTVIITEPAPLDPNAQFTDVTCNGLNDGTAISIPIGGTPTYSYSWTGNGGPYNTQSIGPLASGQYIVTVTDFNGCIGIDTVNLINPPALTANATATNTSCGAICDGIATATPNGGTPGYTYQWDDPASQTTATATGLCFGTYTVTITDTNGCTAQDTTVITNLITIVINPSVIGISCNGVCDGSATAVATGGVLPYSYLWNNGDTSQTSNGLCPGMIYVTVTDASGCSSTDSIIMPTAPPVLVPNGSLDQGVSCNGACDAMVSSAPTGGTTPYTVVWTLPSGIDTNNVCPPFAVVTVTDANGCSQSDTIIVIEPDSIAPNPVIVDLACNGDNTGSISLTPTGGNPGYIYLWSGGQTTSSITNQPAGNYTVTITDTTGCPRMFTYTINEPPALTTSPIFSNMSCNGVCDGMATVTIGGGTAPYLYNWSPGGETTDTILNLCANNYSVLVTDANGCNISQNFTITEPNLLDANVTGTNITCGGGVCDGSAISNPTGGTAPYTYSWSANAAPNVLTNQSINNLCTAIYNVTVTDTNGCTANGMYEVTTPPMIAVTLDSTNITCNGLSDGTATATPTGGIPPYTYSWVGPCAPSPANTPLITGLCAGVYTVTVTDFVGCFFTGSINITEPTAIDGNEVITLANCGVCDGGINMFPTGGTPGYSHSWSNGVTTPNNTNLCAGFYTDTITDNNNCINTFTIAVSNPTGPSGVTPTVNDATCFGTCDGAINVIVIGGAAPFSYAWNSVPVGGPYANDSTITGLCAGTYNLTVTDASNCQLNTSVIVGEADSIAPNPTFTDVNCNGNCDGTASVSPSGGTAPYTFSWSNGQTTSSVSGLCAGAISVIITDANGCTKTENFNIVAPIILTATTSKTAATCNGNCDGSATANPSGGTTPYTYLWDDALAQTTQTATGLCAGTYNLTITDANGCSITLAETITEPTLIVANETITNATCGNSDGSATVTPTGGTGPYTYLWCNGVTTATSNALPAGTCSLDITDGNGCTQTFLINISNTVGPTVTVNSTNASCNGVCDGSASATATGVANFTYLWLPGGQTTSSITGLCAGNYSVQVTDANGCSTVEPVTILDNTAITATLTTTDASCNGTCDGTAIVVPTGGVPPYQYNWAGGVAAGQTTNSVGGLCAGNYTATITDALGCTFIQNVVINEPNILTVSPIGVAANCNGSCDGSATANPTGGSAPFTYLWSTGATTPTVVGLCAGSYTVTVTDANGCTADGVVNIGEGALITATINSTDATCGVCDGAATITAAGGAGSPYTYLWSPGGETTTTVNNLCPGAYQVDVTDALGCSQIFNVLVNNVNGPNITASADSVTCFGSCDGAAYVVVNSGTPIYTFQWDDITLQTNDTATALCAGLYNIIVQDGLGCITVDSVTVQEPQELLANITSTPPSCPLVCDGTATVNPTGGVGTISLLWGASAGGQTTATATGLCAGTHLVTLTDSKGCTKIDSVTLTDPTLINITLTATTTTCNGDCDATAFSVVSGGTPAYTYSWNTTPIQTNTLANGLCAGNYILTVTDANGCTQNDNITVVDPPVLATTSTPTATSCNGVCDGSITTNPTGGVAPYTYIWSDGQTTQTASNLCAGTYNVVVSDFNNCTTYDTIIVTEPNVLNDSTVVTGPTCGLCDGSATSTPFGGTGPFTFVWTDPITGLVIQTTVSQATSTIVGLCAGTIDLEITDLGSGCISNHIIIVNNSTGPTVAITATDETCASACNGTALASATAGTTPYTFSWNTTPVQTDSNATSLCAGFYTVTVTDAVGCITTDTVTINTNSLNLAISNIIPETCFGDCDGSATVTSSSGVSPFTYVWNPTAQITQTATNLCVGTYVATVTDNLSCRDSISTNITGPTILTVTASENSAIACNANCDGAAIATPLGGNPNYTYLWNDPLNQTTQIATGLCAGTYIVVVTDNNGCTASDTVTLGEPTAILANETLTAPNCNQCDGIITLAPSGGVGPYTFVWTTPTSPPNPPTGIINNLCAGGYSVEITDDTGCTATFNFPLSSTNAPLPNTTVTNISCFGVCDGSITSAATGGTAPYTYLWQPVGGNGANATNLCAGTYTLNVTDALGCIGVAIDSVSQPAILQVNVNSANIICAGSCDGWAVVNLAGGTAPFTFNWTPGNLPQDSITNLCAGTYTATIVDGNGCSAQDSAIISEPAAITSTAVTTPTSCSANCDGAATLTVNGGVGPYAFEWNGNTASGQTNTQTGLCFGLNTVLITDNGGCNILDSIYLGATDTVLADAGNDTTNCIGSPVDLIGTPGGNFTNVEWFELPSMTSLGTGDTITVNPTVAGVTCYAYQVTGSCDVSDTVCVTTEALPVANAGADVTIVEGTSTTLNATGGGSYAWTPTLTLSDSTIFNPVATPDSTTTYYVTVTSPGGCIATDSVVVTVIPTVNFPNGITPNGDGQNDVWIIDFIEQYPNNVVEIYNRWGELLFHADGYLQDWDGTYNGKNLPIGTYYYIINLNEETIKPFTGPITILR